MISRKIEYEKNKIKEIHFYSLGNRIQTKPKKKKILSSFTKERNTIARVTKLSKTEKKKQKIKKLYTLKVNKLTDTQMFIRKLKLKHKL